MKEIRATTSNSAGRRAFLKSLQADMASLGASASVRLRGRTLSFIAKMSIPNTKLAIRHLRAVRQRRLLAEAKFIHRMERTGIGELFGDGVRVELDRIQPSIVVCRTRKEYEVFHYCRLLQSFPTANLIGRQIRALVYDVGQDRPFLMGVLGLSSSPYWLRCRDEYLGWRLKERSELRARGLNALMQLAVCMSLPPYSYLLCGKLVAALALSDRIGNHFAKAYKSKLPPGGQLLGVVTICAGGKHCPIFNRIMLRPGGLYRHIGETAGYTTACFSEETMNQARRLAQNSRLASDGAIFGKSLRMIKKALRTCNLPYEDTVRIGLKKAVYIGFSSPAALDCLRTGENDARAPLLSENEAIEYWRQRLLPSRTGKTEIVARIERFRGKNLLLSRILM